MGRCCGRCYWRGVNYSQGQPTIAYMLANATSWDGALEMLAALLASAGISPNSFIVAAASCLSFCGTMERAV